MCFSGLKASDKSNTSKMYTLESLADFQIIDTLQSMQVLTFW